MYERAETGNGSTEGEQPLAQRLIQDRRKREALARQLSREAMAQWQRALEGVVAVPTAIALGWASMAMYYVGFLARGFEVLQLASEEIRNQSALMQGGTEPLQMPPIGGMNERRAPKSPESPDSDGSRV